MARFKGYRPDPAGLREIGRSPEMSQACVSAAQNAVNWANNADPDGQYTVTPAAVPGGWQNEYRSGAKLEATKYSQVGVDERVLIRAVNMIEVD